MLQVVASILSAAGSKPLKCIMSNPNNSLPPTISHHKYDYRKYIHSNLINKIKFITDDTLWKFKINFIQKCYRICKTWSKSDKNRTTDSETHTQSMVKIRHRLYNWQWDSHTKHGQSQTQTVQLTVRLTHKAWSKSDTYCTTDSETHTQSMVKVRQKNCTTDSETCTQSMVKVRHKLNN